MAAGLERSTTLEVENVTDFDKTNLTRRVVPGILTFVVVVLAACGGGEDTGSVTEQGETTTHRSLRRLQR